MNRLNDNYYSIMIYDIQARLSIGFLLERVVSISIAQGVVCWRYCNMPEFSSLFLTSLHLVVLTTLCNG